jgi:hypothetical protein
LLQVTTFVVIKLTNFDKKMLRLFYHIPVYVFQNFVFFCHYQRITTTITTTSTTTTTTTIVNKIVNENNFITKLLSWEVTLRVT